MFALVLKAVIEIHLNLEDNLYQEARMVFFGSWMYTDSEILIKIFLVDLFQFMLLSFTNN